MNPEPNRPDPTGDRTLILLHGLPRSGKTTWARSQPYPIVSPDAIRYAVHGQRFFADAEPLVWAVAKVMVRSLFGAGHKVVVVDATNGTRKRRDEWKTGEWRVRFKVVPTPAEECDRRAAAAGDEYIRPVIARMAAEWEALGTEDEALAMWAEASADLGSDDCFPIPYPERS